MTPVMQFHHQLALLWRCKWTNYKAAKKEYPDEKVAEVWENSPKQGLPGEFSARGIIMYKAY